MSTIAVTDQLRAATEVDLNTRLAESRSYLEQAFGKRFVFWNGDTGEVVDSHSPGDQQNAYCLAELIRAVARDGEPQFVVEADAVLLLTIPLEPADDLSWVATAPFVVSPVRAEDVTVEAAGLLGLPLPQAREWLREQEVWSASQLIRLAKVVQHKLASDHEAQRLQREVDLVSQNLASTYEEISLLYTVTQNLRISSTDQELGRLTLEWLVDCIPAQGLAIQLQANADPTDSTYESPNRPDLVSVGECPLGRDEFTELIEHLQLASSSGPFVGNLPVTQQAGWPQPDLRQLIVTPISEGEHVFGWLAAFNHCDDSEFGTVEANLLNSVGALLGIHSSNRKLYRQQSEMVATVVRALVSAIDAKDPYTSGHSDRVARFAVRLALEMRCDPKLVNTIYMAGLLHDVGKIGIDDSVLRKAGRLTEAEFEHIKLHPEMGFKILADIKQLAEVLPAVLHHHEQWDGNGYPHGLAAEEIPLMARIMAVADAYDAMTSDRPYREGMPDAKVDNIFREGKGNYWDPAVVKAYFDAKPDIEEIRSRDRKGQPTDRIAERWV